MPIWINFNMAEKRLKAREGCKELNNLSMFIGYISKRGDVSQLKECKRQGTIWLV